MRKSTAAGLVAALTLSLLPAVVPTPAEAAPEHIIHIRKAGMPSDWPVVSAAGWLDVYTGKSRFKLVSACPAQRDCVTIRAGKVSGKSVGWTGATTRHEVRAFDGSVTTWATTTITIDTAKAKRLRYSKADRKWLLAHELGHTLGLKHQSKRVSFMYPYVPRPPMKLTTAERKYLAGR